jgi:hypothetical protein
MRETGAQERLVQRSVEENKKQKGNSNEEMERVEDTDESKTNEEAQPRRNSINNLMGSSFGLLPSWKEPSGDDEALEEASPQQSGESTDMPTMESSDGNEKAKVDRVADKKGKQADTGKPTSGPFGFFAGSSNETKQQKPTVEKGSDAQTKGGDQSDQKDQSHSEEPQDVNSGRQSEEKGAQKTADGGLLSFFLGAKGKKKESEDHSKQKDEQDEKPSGDSKDNRPSGTKETDVPEDDPTKYDNDRLEKVFRETVEDLESALGAPLRLSAQVQRDEEQRLEAEQLKATTMSEPEEQSGGLATDVGETSTDVEAYKKPDSLGNKTQGAKESIWNLLTRIDALKRVKKEKGEKD